MAPLTPGKTDRPLTIRVERRDDAALVTLSGSCTMEVSTQIRHCLVGLATDRVRTIVVDLTGIDFMDSVGLGGIVAAHLRCRHHGGVIRLVGPVPAIREILDLTRLSQLFSIHESIDAALSA